MSYLHESMIRQPYTFLSDETLRMLGKIRLSEYSVLSGKNNSGKSYILKKIAQNIGKEAKYVGPARYVNFRNLSLDSNERNRKEKYWESFRSSENNFQNNDKSNLSLSSEISQFDDCTRNIFFELMSKLLDVNIEIAKANPENEMSQRYLRCNGHNFSYTSSGTRLIASILSCLLDKEYSTLIIDEPELGISPEAQGILADFLFDKNARKKYFPHINTLILATHSSIFLDRRRISNNYIVEKKKEEIKVTQVQTQQELNNIHFFLLGNRFETLFLPSGIFIVEGKCDEVYLKRLLQLEYPQTVFSVIQAGDDARVSQVIAMASGFFADLQKSPYRDRIIPILDSKHTPGLAQKISKQGIPEENIIIWSKNGIEYYYPESILEEIFGEGGEIIIDDDPVTRNSISYKKFKLAEKVSTKLTKNLVHPNEVEEKLLSKLRRMAGDD